MTGVLVVFLLDVWAVAVAVESKRTAAQR